VYRIPPLNKNEGHRANDWGDLAAPLWKGRLRVLENSKGATLMFEDATTGESAHEPRSVTANLNAVVGERMDNSSSYPSGRDI
jgi:ABC-type Fe3+ transport system substrate-binding protein